MSGSLPKCLTITFANVGFPDSSVGKESASNAGDPGSTPGFGKIPWRRERLPTPVFWPGELHGLYSPWCYKESDVTEQLSLHFTSHLTKPIADFCCISIEASIYYH